MQHLFHTSHVMLIHTPFSPLYHSLFYKNSHLNDNCKQGLGIKAIFRYLERQVRKMIVFRLKSTMPSTFFSLKGKKKHETLSIPADKTPAPDGSSG